MTYFHLEKPKLIDISKITDLWLGKTDKKKDVFALFEKSSTQQYLYWDKVKYFQLPEGVTPIEGWSWIKHMRHAFYLDRQSQVKTEKGDYFVWNQSMLSDELFHEIDLNLGGNLQVLPKDIDEKEKNRLIMSGITEEAIASSQIEGANTSRVAAKRFLKEGRRPRDRNEQMILNNFETIKLIEQEYKSRKLDLSLLFEVHAMLVKKTIPDNEIGRFRKNEEEIVVQNKISGLIYYVPPKSAFVEQEIERLIKYFNDELKDTFFVHPLIKAIILHFWMGYLHPFVDGNGRLARAIFYWYLLKNDYWAFSYLPISKIIRKSPAQYGMSYIYAEQDDFDLTYFLDYNLRKIKQAMREFEVYFKTEQLVEKEMDVYAKKYLNLNKRQNRLLLFFYKHPEERITLKIHMNTNQISKQTAVNDLRDLLKNGFLKSQRAGRNIYYLPTEKVSPKMADRHA